MDDVLQVHHRHVVFTIDEGLWDNFLVHRHLLKTYMDEAVRVVQEYFVRSGK